MGSNVTLVGKVKDENKKELKKHAAAIHCSNSLSLLQRKISNALLYHAYKELKLKEEHEITVKQLCRLIGYQGNNHAAIKDAFKGLMSTIIEWNLINDETGSENWTASTVIASVSLEGPICYYAYSPRMKQLLHSPSMFGKIDLVLQSKFRSSYGLALYENCIRYRGLPYTKWFEMKLFKKLMGVPDGSYEVFRDFKRRVLDKAIDEVNTYSDLVIAAEYLREGRKPVSVRFRIKERAKKTRLGQGATRASKNENSLEVKLQGIFNFSQEQVLQLLQEHERGFIEEKIAVVEATKPFREGKIQNLAGYLLSAIKNNYQAPKTQAVVKLTAMRQEIELNEIKRQVEAIRTEYLAYREQVINEKLASLSDSDREHLQQAFLHSAEPAINTVLKLQGRKYSRGNILDSPIIRAQFRQFTLHELEFPNLLAVEEYVAQLTELKRAAWQQLKSFDPDHPSLHFSD